MVIKRPHVYAWVWCRWERHISQVLLDGFKGRATSPFVDGDVRGAPKAPISSGKTTIRFDGVERLERIVFPHHAIQPEGCNGRAQRLPCQASIVVQYTACGPS